MITESTTDLFATQQKPVVVRLKTGADIVAVALKSPKINAQRQIIGANMILLNPLRIQYLQVAAGVQMVSLMPWIDRRISDSKGIEIDENEVLALLPISDNMLIAYNGSLDNIKKAAEGEDDDESEAPNDKDIDVDEDVDMDDDEEEEGFHDLSTPRDFIMWGKNAAKGNTSNITEWKNSKKVTPDWYNTQFSNGALIPSYGPGRTLH